METAENKKPVKLDKLKGEPLANAAGPTKVRIRKPIEIEVTNVNGHTSKKRILPRLYDIVEDLVDGLEVHEIKNKISRGVIDRIKGAVRGKLKDFIELLD